MTAASASRLCFGRGTCLAVAHQLARRGQSVTVISRRRSEAAGFVAAGMLAPHAEGLSATCWNWVKPASSGSPLGGTN